jgi:hypothetical protein
MVRSNFIKKASAYEEFKGDLKVHRATYCYNQDVDFKTLW